MRLTKITTAVLLLLSFGGCVTSPSPEMAAIDDGICRSYDAKPGEPAYVACRPQIHIARNGCSCFGSCH
jgi:hypothetical protein